MRVLAAFLCNLSRFVSSNFQTTVSETASFANSKVDVFQSRARRECSSMLVKTATMALSTIVFFGAPTTASAKELVNRLGIGVKNDSSINLPALSVIYYPAQDFALTAGLGIDTEKDGSRFAFSGGVRRIVFKEDNMNFFMGGELGLVNREVLVAGIGEKQSGFFLSGLFGGEFFFAGLENLGFSFQGGVGIVSLKDVRFRTIAEAPLQAAVTFYF